MFPTAFEYPSLNSPSVSYMLAANARRLEYVPNTLQEEHSRTEVQYDALGRPAILVQGDLNAPLDVDLSKIQHLHLSPEGKLRLRLLAYICFDEVMSEQKLQHAVNGIHAGFERFLQPFYGNVESLKLTVTFKCTAPALWHHPAGGTSPCRNEARLDLDFVRQTVDALFATLRNKLGRTAVFVFELLGDHITSEPFPSVNPAAIPGDAVFASETW